MTQQEGAEDKVPLRPFDLRARTGNADWSAVRDDDLNALIEAVREARRSCDGFLVRYLDERFDFGGTGARV